MKNLNNREAIFIVSSLNYDRILINICLNFKYLHNKITRSLHPSYPSSFSFSFEEEEASEKYFRE